MPAQHSNNVLDFNWAGPQQSESERRQDRRLDADEVRQAITLRAREFVEWLFPGTVVVHKSGRYAVVGDIYGQPGESLEIELTGPKAGYWNDHASATDGGRDLLSLFMASNNFGASDFPQALEIIHTEFLGHAKPERKHKTFTVNFTKRAKQHKNKPRPNINDRPLPSETYVYRDVDGSMIGVVRRYVYDDIDAKTGKPRKTFSVWDARNSKAQTPTPRPLYRLDQIKNCSEVVFVEGERKADALATVGVQATCIMFGSNAKFDEVNWTPMIGKRVIIWPDKDPPGWQFAVERLAPHLTGLGCEVSIVIAPNDKPEKWDAYDCVAEGGDPKTLIAAAQPYVQPTAPSLILSSAEFLKDFTPPDYLISTVLQRGKIYSFTGDTGHGKTAIALLLAAVVALGKQLDGYEVERGRVLYLAGENPDDIRMRWIVMADHMPFDIDAIDVHFLPGVFKLSEIGLRIIAEVEKIGPVALVIIDTSAAYFEGDAENENVQAGDHARRMRSLLRNLPGLPCGLICCHPVKNAQPDNLLPRGGGAFLNEVDGNFTCWKTDSVAMMHWQGKLRGPDFEPIPFGFSTLTAPQLKDSKGNRIPMVVAHVMTEEETNRAENAARTDENVVLVKLKETSMAVVPLRELATWCGWRTKDGKPNKPRAQRATDRLKKAGLVEATRGGFCLTAKGRRAAEKIA